MNKIIKKKHTLYFETDNEDYKITVCFQRKPAFKYYNPVC